MTHGQTIGTYLDALASSAPAPGGGSVAGLVNALGCALGEMVTALTPASAEATEVHEAVERLQRLRAESVGAMARDEDAYAGYIAAAKLPKDTAEEKSSRRRAMQAALVTAAEAPLALAGVALETLTALQPVAVHGNKHVLSDARIAAMLADVAARAALVNVRVNVALIKDPETAARLANAATEIEHAARRHLAQVEATLDDRATRG